VTGKYGSHQTRLGMEMRRIADHADLPKDHELRTVADEFDARKFACQRQKPNSATRAFGIGGKSWRVGWRR